MIAAMERSPSLSGSWSALDVARQDDTLIVTLNRPDRRNALDPTMMRELNELWSGHAALSGARCIVVTGAGPGFCAGADVDLLASDRADARADVEDELAFLPGRRTDIPVIAAINGVCAGGGLHFVADADVVIAASTATFLDPHVSIGQVSAYEVIGLLRKMPAEAVFRMALTGRYERIDAARARQLGMVSQVVEPGELEATAQALGEAIAANSPAATAATKRALWGALELGLTDACRSGAAELVGMWGHSDQEEGPRAFAEKRPATWHAGDRR